MATLTGARALSLLCGTLLLGLTLTYLLAAVLPFYANGIDLYTPGSGTGYLLDPKGLAPFSTPLVGGFLYLAAIMAGPLFRWLGIPLALVVILALFCRFNKYSSAERALWISTLTAFVAILVLTWSIWSKIGLWLFDMLI